MQTKNKRGRPDHYEPWMDAKSVELMAEGASKTEVAAELGLGSKQMLYEYCKKYDSFRDAIKKGELLSEAWWERHGRKNIGNKEFNSTLWYMNMKNRFKWSDRTENSHSFTTQEDALKALM